MENQYPVEGGSGNFVKQVCTGGQIKDVINIVDCSADNVAGSTLKVIVQQSEADCKPERYDSPVSVSSAPLLSMYETIMFSERAVHVRKDLFEVDCARPLFEDSETNETNIVTNLLKRRKINAKCCAVNCSSKDCSVLFYFPCIYKSGVREKVFDALKIQQLKIWVMLCGNFALLHQRPENLHKTHFLCSGHFDNSQFSGLEVLTLCENAVPTVFQCNSLPEDSVDFLFMRLQLFADKVRFFETVCDRMTVHDLFQSDTVNCIDQVKAVSDLTGYSDVELIDWKDELPCSTDNNNEKEIICDEMNNEEVVNELISCNENQKCVDFQCGESIVKVPKKRARGRVCCVVNCPYDLDKQSLFAFPKLKKGDSLKKEDVVRFGLWVQRSGNVELLKYSPYSLCTKFFICGGHFDGTCFTNLRRNRLHTGAIPMAFDCVSLPDHDLKNFLEPLVTITEFANPLLEVEDFNLAVEFQQSVDSIQWFTCVECKAKHLTTVKKCIHRTKCNLFQEANNMDPGNVPVELQDLSFVEERLIARVHPVISVFKLKGLQYGYSGNVINFSQDVSEFAKSLPHRIDHIATLMSVKFENGVTEPKYFKVRAKKVYDALMWLKRNNKYYADISINEENIDLLPDDGNVFHNVCNFNADIDCEVKSSDCELNDINEETENNSCSEDYNSILNPDADDIQHSGVPFIHKEKVDDLVMNNILDWPSMNPNPIDEFKTPGYIACAFPTLFCYGSADLRDAREKKVDTAEYFKHLLFYHDGRFARHTTFRFFALNSYMRWTACTNGSIFIKNNREFENITVADLQDLLKTNPNIMKKIMYQNSNIRGSKPFWAARSAELTDMVENLGLPTFFLTLSCADHHWPELFRILTGQDDVTNLNEKQRRELIQNNPLTVDAFFHEKLDIYIDKVLKPKFKIKDMWYRIEYQHRGSPHMHGIFWSEGAVDVSNIDPTDSEQLQEVADYFSSFITAVNPDPNFNASTEHPCRSTYCSNNINPDDDLAHLLVKVQRHKCSPDYCQRMNKKTKKKQCRFHYPFNIEEKGVIRVDDAGHLNFFPARNDMYLNKFNPFILRTWRANMDISPVLSKAALLQYLAKYISKCETKSVALNELIGNILSTCGDDDEVLKPLRRLYIRTCSDRDYSAQEVCHLLSGRFMYYTGARNFICINFLNEEWTLVQNNKHKKIGLSSIEKYRKRPSHLKDVSLFQVCQNYNLCTWSKKIKKKNIVRIFPKLKLGTNVEENEKYYKQLAHLHIPWDGECLILPEGSSWSNLCTSKNVSHQHQLNLIVSSMEQLRNENDFEEEDVGDEDHNLDEAMIASLLAPNQSVPDIELGLRPIDLQFDWSCAIKKYENMASINELQNFIQVAKRTYNNENANIEYFDINEYQLSSEQLNVIAQVNQQIESIKSNQLNNCSVPFKTIIQGKAGTGKSLIIKYMTYKIKTELGFDSIMLLGPTGVAALNIKGETVHSGLHIPVRKQQFAELNGEVSKRLCDKMKNVKFVIIDEYSMIGCSLLHMIHERCCQAKGNAEPFGGLFIYLMGDIRQLAPIGDDPFYRFPAPFGMGHKGKLLIQDFEKCFILKKCFRQNDNIFLGILDRLSVGESTIDDYGILSQRFYTNIGDMKDFENAMHLYSTRKMVSYFNSNVLKLAKDQEGNEKPIAKICAKHNSSAASKASVDTAEGLEKIIYLSRSCIIMLKRNFWTEKGLVNGAVGEVVDIVYKPDECPPENFPEIVMCKFPNYTGPGVGPLNLVPIPSVTASWSTNGYSYTRQQFPLSVAYAITIAKSQGVTLEKAAVDIEEKEFQLGNAYVGMSRVKTLAGLALEPFLFTRISNLKNFVDMKRRNEFEKFLKLLETR